MPAFRNLSQINTVRSDLPGRNSIFGSLVAHPLVLNASWRWVFWIGLIFGSISLVGTAVFYFPPTRPRRTEKTRAQVILQHVASDIRNSSTWTSWGFSSIRQALTKTEYISHLGTSRTSPALSHTNSKKATKFRSF